MQKVRVTDMSYNRFVEALTEYATFHKATYHSDTAEQCVELKQRVEQIETPDTIELTDKEHAALETALNNHYADQQNAHSFL